MGQVEAASATTVQWQGRMLIAALQGRATARAIDELRGALEQALAAERPFVVLFDRRTLTATTSDGRSALQRWSEELTPRLGSGCRAWADLFDERRAASLARAAAARPTTDSPLPYPQQTFADEPAARAWLSAALTN